MLLFIDALRLASNEKKVAGKTSSGVSVVAYSKYCEWCEHSNKFAFLLGLFRGDDDADNVLSTMKSMNYINMIDYYNSNLVSNFLRHKK